MYRDRVGGIPAYTADVATSGGRALVRPETVEVRTEVTDARRLGRRPGWLTDLLVIIARRPVHIYKHSVRRARRSTQLQVAVAEWLARPTAVCTAGLRPELSMGPFCVTQPNPTHYK